MMQNTSEILYSEPPVNVSFFPPSEAGAIIEAVKKSTTQNKITFSFLAKSEDILLALA